MSVSSISERNIHFIFVFLFIFVALPSIAGNLDKLKACRNVSDLRQVYDHLHNPNRTVTAFYHMRLYELLESPAVAKLLLGDIPTENESSYYFPDGFYKVVVKLLPDHPTYIANYLKLAVKQQGNADESYCDSIGPLILNCRAKFFQALDRCPKDIQEQVLGCLELSSWDENSKIRRMVFAEGDISIKWKMWFQRDTDLLLIDLVKRQKLDFVKQLLNDGANPFARDQSGKNAIDYAKELNKKKILGVLLNSAKKKVIGCSGVNDSGDITIPN